MLVGLEHKRALEMGIKSLAQWDFAQKYSVSLGMERIVNYDLA